MTITEPAQLGSLIRRLRLAAGLSQEQLAERSGLSARAISDLERGLRSHTRPETLRMLAAGLGLTDDGRAELLAAARPELRTSADQGTRGPITPFAQPTIDLPIPPGPLIGRDEMVANLVSELNRDDHRLITLTGPGGVGKTRLAVEVAHRAAPAYSGGVAFVDLTPVTDPDLVASAIAHTLGIRESRDRPVAETLRAALATLPPLLLLLDNFEHVIEAAPLIGNLLSASNLHLLVTSREALRLRTEHEVVVSPLDLPSAQVAAEPDELAETPAIALFLVAAARAKPGFALSNETAPPVVEICRRLDGLPLAIELAATRIRHYPPAVLLEHLEHRLPLLTGGPRDLPARQQTLRDTIAWSYNLLAPDEQALFRRLGVFVGGASLPAIEAVVPAAGKIELELLTGLASLVDKSLLREGEGYGGTPRFSMLETVREFALANLDDCEELAPAMDGHARHFLDFTEKSSGLREAYRDTDLLLVDEEIDNIRAAFDWYETNEDATGCARIAADLYGFCHLRGLDREARSRLDRSLALAEANPLPDHLRGWLLNVYSHSATILGNPALGEAIARESLNLMQRPRADRVGLQWSLILLAISLREQNRFDEAKVYAGTAHQLALDSGDKGFEAYALYHVGTLAFLLGNLDAATTTLNASIDLARSLGLRESTLYAVMTLAEVHTSRGQLNEAASLFRETDRLWRTGNFTGVAGFWLGEVAELAAAALMYESSAKLFGFSEAFHKSFGSFRPTYPGIDEVIAGVRDSLGDAAFEAAYASGRGLKLEDAITLALDILDRIERVEPP